MYCICTLLRGGMYWEIRPPRKRDFPRAGILYPKAREIAEGCKIPPLGKSPDSRGIYFPMHPDSRQCSVILSALFSTQSILPDTWSRVEWGCTISHHYKGSFDLSTVNTTILQGCTSWYIPRDGLLIREWPNTALSWDALGCTMYIPSDLKISLGTFLGSREIYWLSGMHNLIHPSSW